MNGPLTVIREFHVTRRNRGRKQLRDGVAPNVATGRVQRMARLMALAIHCDQLIHNSVVADQAELARFGSISTSRMTQIMSLLNLAPDIQEQILFLPRKQRGHDMVQEAGVRPIASELDWRKQRRMWAALQRAVSNTDAISRQVALAPRSQPGC
ncbi:MAG: hypothetical protein IT425_01050 [Pirellulales bacterium]|nr:hypothetical protein [Pirellulales bacterium]